MSVLDREWMQSDSKPGRGDKVDVVKVLIGINVAIFLLGFLTKDGNQPDWTEIWGSYSVYAVFDLGQVWRLVTYQFLHANLGHIAFNMIALWFFGRAVEREFGSGKFLGFYLICGIAAALFSSALGYLGLWDGGMRENAWKYIPMVGASGSIYGIIAACAILFPHSRVMLIFPPIDMSVRTFSLAVLGLAVIVIAMDWNNAGGEAGHMGGMLMGFLLMGLRQLLCHRKALPQSPPYQRTGRSPRTQPPSRKEVDAILEKIGKEGLDSLTERERDVLKRASQGKKY